ncbi:MAG TPA: hypothetical protein PLQ93_12840 [Bacteroidia bacterium]|nr:hypothetical protein [Bacteroidia bacterium]
MLYLQKGGSNTSKTFSYDQYGNVNGYGTMSLPTLLRYYSVAPCFKFRLSDLLYAKAGPRLDLYSSSLLKDIPPGLQSPEPYYTFEAVNYGISYALGISAGKGKIRFLAELMGQNDFGSSSYNNSTSQSYSNNAYYLNIGVLLCLKN